MISQFKAETKMNKLLQENMDLIFVLNQFSIPLGFGDKSIDEVCKKAGIPTESFLAMIQFHNNPENPDLNSLCKLNPETILGYLRKSHSYFLEYRLPSIREKLNRALNNVSTKETIITYFEEYEREVHEHMEYENLTFFPYSQNLVEGIEQEGYSVKDFEVRHNDIEEKLEDLINLIVKYLPTQGDVHLLADILNDLKKCDKEISIHSFLEDRILVPKITSMEKNVSINKSSSASESEDLSDREKEIVCGVARGLSNKEIAEELFISVHTVITHRRNISRKLSIHSSAGLTVYAILNNLITIEELKAK